MRYLKKYESICSLPKVGQYAIFIDHDRSGQPITKSGEILYTTHHTYIIKNGEDPWENISIDINDIKYWSDSEEDLEIYMSQIKYNL